MREQQPERDADIQKTPDQIAKQPGAALMVVSLWGPDIHAYDSSGSNSTIPSGVVLGLFAVIGSWAVAKHGFRRTSDNR